MNLTTADKVASQIELMKRAEDFRKPQRALLNRFFNGEAPWTDQEAKDAHVLINFNDKQGANLLHQARNQCENAFSKRDQFFRVSLPDCKHDLRRDWEDCITRHINDALQSSAAWYHTQDMVWGAVCLHGVGAKIWWDQDNPIPNFVGPQDLLIPTDTDLTLENLPCLAIRRKMRPGLLFRKTIALGDKADPGWDLPAVRKLLDEYKDLNENPNSYNWTDHPEQMAELYKQNSGGYYDSDVAPEIWFWDFWHREEGLHDTEPGWYQKLLLDRDCSPGRTGNPNDPVAFVYNSRRPFCQSADHFIHFQFGDGNNVPPFLYHSIRSLAYLTYELCWTLNRLNCQFTQHLFENLMTFVRVSDPNDRARLNKVILTPPFAIIPDGLQIVPAADRYSADANLMSFGMSQYKQRLGDVSSAYTQQIDTGTRKERTKFEVQAVLAQTSALMSSLLGRLYRQETFAYREIARRFTLKNSTSFMVRKFQAACAQYGIPERWQQFEAWKIEADQILGAGNRAMQIAEAAELMANREAFDPEAQQEIKHDWTLAITNNPHKAARIAPLARESHPSSSAHDAHQIFATLMLGVDLEPMPGLNHVDQITTLLACMAQVAERIETTDQTGTQQEVIGLANTARFIAKHIAAIAHDEKLAPLAKKFGDDLGQLMNLVKAFAQRQQQAAEAAQQPQPDPATLAKAQSTLITTQAKLTAKTAADQQKLQHKQTAFSQSQAQKAAQFALDEQRKSATTAAEIQRQNLLAKSSIDNQPNPD